MFNFGEFFKELVLGKQIFEIYTKYKNKLNNIENYILMLIEIAKLIDPALKADPTFAYVNYLSGVFNQAEKDGQIGLLGSLPIQSNGQDLVLDFVLRRK